MLDVEIRISADKITRIVGQSESCLSYEIGVLSVEYIFKFALSLTSNMYLMTSEVQDSTPAVPYQSST